MLKVGQELLVESGAATHRRHFRPIGKAARIRRWMGRAALMVMSVSAVTGNAGSATAGSATASSASAESTRAERPNIVVILVDDMGYSDIGSFGGEIPTPNIDALAKTGLRYTQFYNAARCSPTRASLLTGLYPHQAGVGHLESVVIPGSTGSQGKLANRAVTLAEVAGSAGYYTAISGKWHIGASLGVGPWQRGFKRSMVTAITPVYFPDQQQGGDAKMLIDGRPVPLNSPELSNGYWYSSDLYTDWGIKFIEEARSEKKPFLLYLSFTAPHFPIMAPQETVAKFKGKYLEGWDKLRAARFARQKELGIFPRDTQLSVRPDDLYDWNKLSQSEKERYDSMMAVYAASISRVDTAVGRLVAQLKADGTYDNTLILFMSDNGGNGEAGPDGRFHGGPPGGPKSIVWTGANWAMLQNTPYAKYKHYTEEGGIATPLIAHWPRGIAAARNGTMIRQPGHLVDVMPTVVQVTGAKYPQSYNGNRIVPMSGASLVPTFSGKSIQRRAPLFWEHEGNRAIRDGRWKLVAQFDQPWRLYDLIADPTERNDLASAQPARVAAMANAWDRWASDSYVPAWQDRYDPYLGGNKRESWGTSDPARRAPR
jgi:arylsulfatase